MRLHALKGYLRDALVTIRSGLISILQTAYVRLVRSEFRDLKRHMNVISYITDKAIHVNASNQKWDAVKEALGLPEDVIGVKIHAGSAISYKTYKKGEIKNEANKQD